MRNRILDCRRYGTYRDLQALSDIEISNRLAEAFSPIWAALPKNEASMTFYRDFTQQVKDQIISAKSLVANVRTFPSDYNAALKRYTCQAEITYAEHERDLYLKASAFVDVALAQVDSWTPILSSGNPVAIKLMMVQAPRMADAMRGCLVTKTSFTIQPIGSTPAGFVIDWRGSHIDLRCLQGAKMQ